MKNIIESHQIESSAPCRIDMGGTLDISTFYYPLRHLYPCTVNIAINLRTTVQLLPYDKGVIKVVVVGKKLDAHQRRNSGQRHAKDGNCQHKGEQNQPQAGKAESKRYVDQAFGQSTQHSHQQVVVIFVGYLARAWTIVFVVDRKDQ